MLSYWLLNFEETVSINVEHYIQNGLNINDLKNEPVQKFLKKITLIPIEALKAALTTLTEKYFLAKAAHDNYKMLQQQSIMREKNQVNKLTSPGADSFKYASPAFRISSRGERVVPDVPQSIVAQFVPSCITCKRKCKVCRSKILEKKHFKFFNCF